MAEKKIPSMTSKNSQRKTANAVPDKVVKSVTNQTPNKTHNLTDCGEKLVRTMFVLPESEYRNFKAYCALNKLEIQNVMYDLFKDWYTKENISF